MTVLPGDAATLTLVCDGCGAAVNDIDSRPSNWPVVWAVVSRHGWGGSPLMIGLHYCPRCCGVPPVAPTQHPTDHDRANGWSTVTGYEHASVVGLHGNLDLLVATELGHLLTEALRRSRNLVLDLSSVRTVDSTVLGILVRTRQTARDHGGHVCLAGPSGFVATVLHTMRLTPAFEIFPNTDDALAWLAAANPTPPAPPARE